MPPPRMILRMILVLCIFYVGFAAFKAAANIGEQINARAVAISATRY